LEDLAQAENTSAIREKSKWGEHPIAFAKSLGALFRCETKEFQKWKVNHPIIYHP
jgi:hypothetical protein